VFPLLPEEVAAVEWMEVARVKELIKRHSNQVTDGLEQVINRFF